MAGLQDIKLIFSGDKKENENQIVLSRSIDLNLLTKSERIKLVKKLIEDPSYLCQFNVTYTNTDGHRYRVEQLIVGLTYVDFINDLSYYTLRLGVNGSVYTINRKPNAAAIKYTDQRLGDIEPILDEITGKYEKVVNEILG